MKFLYSLLLFIPSFLFGQTKVEELYYDSLYKPVLVKEHAKYLMRTTFNDTFPNKWIKEKIDVLDSNHINTVIYKDYYTVVNSDTFKTSISYFENKSIASIISYKNNKKNGILKTFYKNGNIKSIDSFENNVLTSESSLNKNINDTFFFITPNPPMFKGGEEAFFNFVKKNLKYPEPERDNEIEGIIIVIFVVEINGTVSDVTTDGKGNQAFQRAAIDLIYKTSGKWKPASTGNGVLLKVKVKTEIVFRLD